MTKEVISQAKARGDRVYSTGEPCKNGHVSERYIQNNSCVKCASEAQVKYRNTENAKRIQRNLGYIREYGLTLDEFEFLLESRHHKCLCCKRAFGTDRRPYVDHNHTTGVVRGILCQSCNMCVAAFDNPLRETYAAYVDENGFL